MTDAMEVVVHWFDNLFTVIRQGLFLEMLFIKIGG